MGTPAVGDIDVETPFPGDGEGGSLGSSLPDVGGSPLGSSAEDFDPSGAGGSFVPSVSLSVTAGCFLFSSQRVSEE
jgi:hypothetical protein